MERVKLTLSSGQKAFQQFFRFGLVGIANTAIGFLAFIGIYAIIRSDKHLVALILSSLIAIPVAYLLQSKFVFQSTPRLSTFLSFLALYLTPLPLNLVLLEMLVGTLGMNAVPAQAFLTISLSILMYLFGRFLIFRKR